MDEYCLQAAIPGDSLHVEAGMARGQSVTADDRGTIGSLRCSAALGQTFYDGAITVAIVVCQAARLQAVGQKLRSKRKVSQRLPGYESLQFLRVLMDEGAPFLALFARSGVSTDEHLYGLKITDCSVN